MKLMFITDIHFSSLYAQKSIDTYNLDKADKLIILGDILYHGLVEETLGTKTEDA